MTKDAETREAVIKGALREFLDWEGPPWNIAPDEADRDYEVLALHIEQALIGAGFRVERWSNWRQLAQNDGRPDA